MKEKILIALNDSNLTDALLSRLVKDGYILDISKDGNDVISKLKEFKPGLLLIDTVLPNKSGYDILNEKSFDKDVTKIPVLVISNSGTVFEMNRVPSTPVMKGYIINTHIDPEEVAKKVKEIFGVSTSSAPANTSGKDSSKGKKILWVEDDKLLSTILSRKFDVTGYSLLKANNHEEAFKILESTVPDIIVLDIMLPGMSGLEILQTIKMNEGYKKIPVIMLSNLNKQSDLEKAKVLGANKFMVKAAVSLDEIISAVEELTKK